MDECSSALNSASDAPMSQLPIEIWLRIFNFLPKPTILFTIGNVCKFFRMLSLDPDLWHDVNLCTMKEQMTTKFLHFDDNSEIHGDGVIDTMTAKLLTDGQLTSAQIFCSLFDCMSTAVLKLTISWDYDDFVLGVNEKKTLYSLVNLQYLDVSFCKYITSSVLLEICRHCFKLEVLILEHCQQIEDDELRVLEALQNLKTLNISCCVWITDQGFFYISQMPFKLKQLICDGVHKLSDNGIASLLSGQNMLETLILDGEELTDQSVKAIAHSLPHLKKFQISYPKHLTDKSFGSLSLGKPRLHRLCFKQLKSEKISNDMLTTFFSHECVESLKQLTLADCPCIEDSTVISIATSCPDLEDLTLQSCKVTDTAIEKMVMSCGNLRQMNLYGVTMLEGKWLKSLDLHLPKLKFLDLSFCHQICDDDIYGLVRRKPDLVVHITRGKFQVKVDYAYICDL